LLRSDIGAPTAHPICCDNPRRRVAIPDAALVFYSNANEVVSKHAPAAD
jgi:hypothetical protein